MAAMSILSSLGSQGLSLFMYEQKRGGHLDLNDINKSILSAVKCLETSYRVGLHRFLGPGSLLARSVFIGDRK